MLSRHGRQCIKAGIGLIPVICSEGLQQQQRDFQLFEVGNNNSILHAADCSHQTSMYGHTKAANRQKKNHMVITFHLSQHCRYSAKSDAKSVAGSS